MESAAPATVRPQMDGKAGVLLCSEDGEGSRTVIPAEACP